MKILENTSLFFIVAIVLGLLVPQLSGLTSGYILLFFIIATTFSLSHITLSRSDVRTGLSSSLKAVALSYGLLSVFIIAVAYIFVPGTDYFAGFVILASAPPAVAVIAFTYLLRGDEKRTLGGEVLNYVLALAFAPLITFIFLGSAVSVFEILKVLFLIIIVPLGLSRLANRYYKSGIGIQKLLVNICFALINYSIVGLNSAAILADPVSLGPVLAVNFLTVFVPGTAVFVLMRKFCADKGKCISYALFAAFKNGGMSATLALLLISPTASLPGALHGPFTIGFFMFLEYMTRR
ncbi:MAG: hypothetical protein JW789_03505 [Candidatus Aenigmarchaeota archaeon]|nr:hypothetical protein [Candidatus Aenigmarchaeota archaeon]